MFEAAPSIQAVACLVQLVVICGVNGGLDHLCIFSYSSLLTLPDTEGTGARCTLLHVDTLSAKSENKGLARVRSRATA